MSDNTTTKENSVVIERTFNAPVDQVWQMWTQPEHFKQWYGPQGASIPVAEMDVRVGGIRRVCMEMNTPDGIMTMWTSGEHTEVVDNERLAYTESMSDADGNIQESPDGNHPGKTTVIVQLETLDGQTKMVMTHEGVPADSPGAGGWQQAFGKLDTYLESNSGGK